MGLISLASMFASSRSSAQACLLGIDFYRPSSAPSGLQVPARLYNINPVSGAATLPRSTQVAGVIGLTWGPDGQLYGVTAFQTSFGGTSAGLPNSLYRINPTTGASTLIGPLGIGNIHEGDLTMEPSTGKIYGITGNKLFRLDNFPSPTATVLGTIDYPTPNSTWHISGLEFASNGTLYAVTKEPLLVAPQTKLLTLDINNGHVLSVANLTPSAHGIGGLALSNGQFFYVDGAEPDALLPNFNSLFLLTSTPGLVLRGTTGVVGGLSGLTQCAPPPLPGCVQPPPDLDAWFPFDGNGTDRVMGLTSTQSGAVSYSGGKVAWGMFFNGGSLSTPDSPVLDQGVGDFSVDAWVYVPQGWISAPAVIRSLLDKRSGSRGYGVFLYQNRPALQLADGGGNGGFTNYFSTSPTLQITSVGWHHLTVTVDRDNPHGLVFYVDGASGPPMNPTARQGDLANTSSLFFGKNALDGTSNVVNGGLDEVELFDRVLTAAEVASLYAAGAAGKCKV
jgi:hypothetical protein